MRYHPNLRPQRVPFRLTFTAAGAGGSTVRQLTLWVEGTSLRSGLPAPDGMPSTSIGPRDAIANLSRNWAGYVVAGASSFSEASGAWTVPSLDCAATPSALSSTWVGLGGAPTSASDAEGPLLQSGVDDFRVDGRQVDRAWWELYPSIPNESHPFARFPVNPGDDLSATVAQTPAGEWETELVDETTGLTAVSVVGEGWFVASSLTGRLEGRVLGVSRGLTYLGGDTAEWIVEEPQGPLADFGTITFRDLTTSEPGWDFGSAIPLSLDQGGAVIASPIPNGEVDSFDVNYSS